MLTSLSIQNYALIDQLSIDFSTGLSIITGETGAGKSILLGALGLVLGNRADLNALHNPAHKCIIEAELSIENYQLQEYFEEVDLDYEPNTIFRREILPSGKSRAFVNDTPVTLSVLQELKTRLIDIHSQHQTLALSDTNFQFSVIDALAKNKNHLTRYQEQLQTLTVHQKELEELIVQQREANQQYDYNQHLYNELLEANIQLEEQEVLEEQLEKLNNVEEIRTYLSEALHIASQEETGMQNQLYTITQGLQKISGFAKTYEELYERIASVKIELDDIVGELENATEDIDANPNELERLNDRLQLLYNLQKKHYVDSNKELLAIQTSLGEKVNQVESGEELIEAKEAVIQKLKNELDEIAVIISKNREKSIPKLQRELERLLTLLGMPNAQFSIQVTLGETYHTNGKDTLAFLFSANKGGNFGVLKKVASGGELSRIMLAIKKILSEHSQLPTIIFDEIDTGVSGEVSNKIGAIMQEMGEHMQVIAITHLPQIAAKGGKHYKVFKEENEGVTTSNLKELSKDERIVEIAEMLSGKDISDSALTHAKELLN